MDNVEKDKAADTPLRAKPGKSYEEPPPGLLSYPYPYKG